MGSGKSGRSIPEILAGSHLQFVAEPRQALVRAALSAQEQPAPLRSTTELERDICDFVNRSNEYPKLSI